MKINILIIATSLALVTGAMAQTNLDTSLPITNAPTVSDALNSLVTAIEANKTNWLFEAHGLYAPGLNNKYGGGIGVFYPINDYVLTGIRADWVDGGFWMPSGNATVQYPVKITSWLKVTPFAYAGIGIPLSGATIDGNTIGSTPRNNNGQPTAILGYGGAIELYASTNGMTSLSLLADRETWTGFAGQQYRIGLALHMKF